MGLLSRGRDEVLVWPEVTVLDERRNRVPVPSAAPVSVWGRMQPVSSEEAAAIVDDTVTTVYRFVGRSFPGGPFARVRWDGRDWDVVGEPARRDSSQTTRHVTVHLQARTPKAVPRG